MADRIFNKSCSFVLSKLTSEAVSILSFTGIETESVASVSGMIVPCSLTFLEFSERVIDETARSIFCREYCLFNNSDVSPDLLPLPISLPSAVCVCLFCRFFCKCEEHEIVTIISVIKESQKDQQTYYPLSTFTNTTEYSMKNGTSASSSVFYSTTFIVLESFIVLSSAFVIELPPLSKPCRVGPIALPISLIKFLLLLLWWIWRVFLKVSCNLFKSLRIAFGSNIYGSFANGRLSNPMDFVLVQLRKPWIREIIDNYMVSSINWKVIFFIHMQVYFGGFVKKIILGACWKQIAIWDLERFNGPRTRELHWKILRALVCYSSV